MNIRGNGWRVDCPQCVASKFNCDNHSIPTAYRGWDIYQGRWPEPAWSATGPNYDASYEGPEDGWVATGGHVSANTREELIREIDNYIEEN